MHLLEDNKSTLVGDVTGAMLVFKSWLTTQFYAYLEELKEILLNSGDSNDGLKLKAIAIRTMMGVSVYIV